MVRGLSLALAIGLATSLVAAACSDGESSSAADADAGPDVVHRPPAVGSDDDTDGGFTGPMHLSETGLYSDFASRTLAPGVREFTPAYPLWSDGESKKRYVYVPPGTKIDTSDIDRWMFPVGTKAWKAFYVNGKLVETRFLWKQKDGSAFDGWLHVAYVWNDDGTDAIARPDGVKSVAGTNHDVPPVDDCKFCHVNVTDGLIGFSAFELSKPAAPDADGGAEGGTDGGTDGGGPPANSGLLMTFAREGLFTSPPSADLVVPGDGVVREALAYLHGNCGFCHNEDGLLRFQSVMRLRLHANETTPEGTLIYKSTINAIMRHVMGDGIDKAIVPGEPEQSQLYMRMIATDIVKMPPKGPKTVDPTGSDVVRRWILGLPPQ